MSPSYHQCHCFDYNFLVVTVNFVQNLYSYREDHGLVSDMALILSIEIAQDLTVTASGGNNKYIMIVNIMLI